MALMPRNPNWTLVDATHRILHADPGLTPPQIHRRLGELGFATARSNVDTYLAELKAMGILEPNTNRTLLAPLYPAYLLIDLPTPQARTIHSLIGQHTRRLRRLRREVKPEAAAVEQLALFLAAQPTIDLLEGWPQVMVRARGTQELLRKLEDEVRAAGARSVRTFMVAAPDWAPTAEEGASAA